jgi:RNA polymerase sigma-70 factor, ECF subfamily
MASSEVLSLVLPRMEAAPSEIDLPSLVEGYSRLLFRVAFSVLRDQAEAEDVVQDTLVRVLLHRSELSAVRDLRVWLVRIAWNLALDRKRRLRPEQLEGVFANSLMSHAVPADVVLAEEQRLATVLREIDRLPKLEKHVLLLSAIEEFETSEIAGVLERSESAVRALLSRSRARLRERLEKAGVL